MDPYERADLVSDQFYDWFVKNDFIGAEVVFHSIEFLQTFIEYPPSQLPATFSPDGVEEQIDKINSQNLKPQAPTRDK
jgi:hypothetical protein